MANDFTGLKNRFAKEYKQKAIDVQTNMILDYAPKELKKAYEGRTFRNDTMNLADSYVWVVYYNGIVKGSGYLWAGRTAQTDSKFHGTKINGRRLAQEFINRYVPNGTNCWEMVFAATAPYSTYLESGANGRKFYVLTSIFDEINTDFKGKAQLSKIISY